MELTRLTQIGLVLIVCIVHFPSLADAQCLDGQILFNNECYLIKSNGCSQYNLRFGDQCCLESCVRGSSGDNSNKCCTPLPQTNNVPSNNNNCNQSCGQNQPANCGTGTSPCGTNPPLNCNNNKCQNQPCCCQTPTCQNANGCSNCGTGYGCGSSSCNNCQNPPCSYAINPLCGSGTPCGHTPTCNCCSNFACGTATNPPLNCQHQPCAGQTSVCPNIGTGIPCNQTPCTTGCSGGCGTSNQSNCQQNCGGGTNPPVNCNTYNCQNQPRCDQTQACQNSSGYPNSGTSASCNPCNNRQCPDPTYPPTIPPTTQPPPTQPPTTTVPTTTPAPTTTTMPPVNIEIRCPHGTILVDGVCNLLYCPYGTVMSDKNTCIQIVCPEGTAWIGNKCSPLVPTVQNLTFYNNIINHSNGSKPDITLNTSNKYVINVPLTIPTSSPREPPINSPEPDQTCCNVMTPRICKRPNSRWFCSSRSHRRCGEFCTAPTIYLKPSQIYSSERYLVMTPSARQFDCGVYGNCGQAAAMGGYDCSGCGSNVMHRCSSYCGHYSCPTQSCGFYDQKMYCVNYPGSPGCMPEDGCHDKEWCSSM